MQFQAECRIEYGLQIVTPFFLNPSDCLYIKKSCKFLQRYEKTREMQKEKYIFFSFPSAKKVRRSQSYEKTSEKQKENDFFFLFITARRKVAVLFGFFI